MRRLSKPTAKKYRDGKPAREAIQARIPVCEKCQRSRTSELHEIPRANMRKHVSSLASCVLGLCRSCHDYMHANPAEWPKAKQLALLWWRRPTDLDLGEYNRVAVGMVHSDEILKYATEIRDVEGV